MAHRLAPTILSVAGLSLMPMVAHASPDTPGAADAAVSPPSPTAVALEVPDGHLRLPTADAAPLLLPSRFTLEAADAVQVPRQLAFEYSEAYQTRAKIHRLASFATLPLFGAEALLGQSLYNSAGRDEGKKTAHLVVGGAIGGLFGVNTVTGVWNLLEARRDPHNRKRRLIHGLLMLAADGGFVTTAALGPSREHGVFEGSASSHRAVAFTSIGLATAGYLTMLFGGH